MDVLRKSLLAVSVPLVLLVLVGTIRARVDEATDQALRDLKVFSEALYLVDNHYVEDVRLAQLERGAFQGLAESLDPWSSYWDPEAMGKLVSRDESGRVGLLLMKTPQRYAMVAGVVPGSPADRAGVRQGQFLETVDGLATKDLTLVEAQHLMRGPPGSKVTLGYFRERLDEDEGRSVTLEREDIAALRLVEETPAPGVGLLRVTDLGAGTARDVARRLEGLRQAGVRKLVLDLRHNVGGLASEARALADLFVEGGRVLFHEKGRRGVEVHEAVDAPAWDGELVTLIGSGTVGEAELVAAALRDGETGTLVGQPTFGKRSRQDLVRLRDGAGLFMTVGEYLDAAREPFEAAGIEPAERVARSREASAPDDAAAPPAEEEPTDGARAESWREDTRGSSEADPDPNPEAEAGQEPEGSTEGGDTDAQLERALELLGVAVERKAA